MIRNATDLAESLSWAVMVEEAGAVTTADLRTVSEVVPSRATFTVDTAEGRRFTVTVQEEAVEEIPSTAAQRANARNHG